MDWDKYYEERYRQSREEIMDFCFQIGWIKSSLQELSRFIDEGRIQAGEYEMLRLRSIADAYEISKTECEINKQRLKEIEKELSQVK